MKTQKPELEYMNIAKGIGIVLIVIGHAFLQDSTSPVRSFVYLFHVPLFFIISGYFFKDAYTEQPLELIIRRIKSLWIPFIKWSILFVLLHNLFYQLGIYSTEYSIREITAKILGSLLFNGTEQLLGAFWFINCLFFTVILFLTIRWISIKFNSRLLTPILCTILFIIGNIMMFYRVSLPQFHLGLWLYFITTFIFYLGFLYRKYEPRIPDNIILAAISLTLLVVINLLNIVKIDSIYSVVGDIKYAVLYLVATPILGSYLIFYISRILSRTGKLLFFAKLGKITLTTLALHFLCFKIISLIIINIYNIDYKHMDSFPVIENHEGWFPVYTVVGIIIPYFIDFLYKKIKNH